MTAHLHLASSRSDALSPAPNAAAITVALAEDHAIVRRNLRRLLVSEPGLEVVAEAAELGIAVRQVYAHAPQVLVLDLQMPGGSSLAAIRELREQAPETQIVALTMERSPAFAQRALELGAVAFVLKDQADTELLSAVRHAARGEAYVSPVVAPGVDALRRAGTGDGLPRYSAI